jgi:hypothetical protein
LPHSEIHGSKLIRSSPWLIAAYHVLHRLCMPRHPPDALISLDHSHRQCSPFWRRSRRSPVWGSSALSADCEAIRRPSGLRMPHPEMVHVLVPWSSASGVSGAKREVSLMTYSHSQAKRQLRSFEHRKHEGCAILLMSCSGALCQIHLEIDLTKDQLLETVPRCHAVRHGNRNRGAHSNQFTAASFRMRRQTRRGEGYPCGS